MNSKIYNGNVQPNPKEFKIWVDDEGTIRTWNGTEWIENTAGDGGSSGDGAFTYKSRKVVWRVIDSTKFENNGDMFSVFLEILPIYSCVKEYDDSGVRYKKYYGHVATMITHLYARESAYVNIKFIEEAEGYGINNYMGSIQINTDKGFIGIMESMAAAEGQIVDEESIKTKMNEMFGLEQIPYDEYINFKVDFDTKYANF